MPVAELRRTTAANPRSNLASSCNCFSTRGRPFRTDRVGSATAGELLVPMVLDALDGIGMAALPIAHVAAKFTDLAAQLRQFPLQSLQGRAVCAGTCVGDTHRRRFDPIRQPRCTGSKCVIEMMTTLPDLSARSASGGRVLSPQTGLATCVGPTPRTALRAAARTHESPSDRAYF